MNKFAFLPPLLPSKGATKVQAQGVAALRFPYDFIMQPPWGGPAEAA